MAGGRSGGKSRGSSAAKARAKPAKLNRRTIGAGNRSKTVRKTRARGAA